MLLSLALIFLIGMFLGKLFQRFGLPELLGMLLAGMLLGPHLLNLLDAHLLEISIDLRQIALIIILIRAGLNLDIKDLKVVGRPAILMSFIPASFEMIGVLLLAPKLLNITILEAAIMATVVAAVSPAVVVPRMLKLIDEEYGTNKSIPQMIMASASVDDVFVIVLFTAFTGLAQTGSISISNFLTIPAAIFLGILSGVVLGIILSLFFTRFHMRDTGKVIIILSVSFILVSIENAISLKVGFSGLLAVMALGSTIRQKKPLVAKNISFKFSKLWYGAEVLLFVLVGATVNITYTLDTGVSAMFLVFGALLFRILGVFISLVGSRLNSKERIFAAISYIPKATVQAAIGGLPLAMGLASGNIILSLAVLAIMISAPFGAALMDRTYKKLLMKNRD